MEGSVAPAFLGLADPLVTGSRLIVSDPEETGRLPLPAGEGLKITPRPVSSNPF